jgi:hypothetical protein
MSDDEPILLAANRLTLVLTQLDDESVSLCNLTERYFNCFSVSSNCLIISCKLFWENVGLGGQITHRRTKVAIIFFISALVKYAGGSLLLVLFFVFL